MAGGWATTRTGGLQHWRAVRCLRPVSRKRRCFLCLCLLGVLPVLILQATLSFCYLTPSLYPDPAPSARPGLSPYVQYFPQLEWRKVPIKTVLIWDEGTDFPYGKLGFSHCPVSSCQISRDKRDLQTSDAVIFSSRGLWNTFRGYTMPAWRAPHQVWVLRTMESPPNTILDWSKYQGVFNWTMHYRRDADLYNVYGVLRPRGDPGAQKVGASGLQEERMRNYAREKSKMVAWMASDCVDDARRQRVVQELSRYIQVDTYGDCGDRPCDKHCEEGLKDYRFYLALENSQCRDYITEKFYRPMYWAQIPVTNADVHSTGRVPRGSYIQMSDFRSIEDLAMYLKELASNETAYNQFLQWRRTHTIKFHPDRWCQICRELHNRSRPAQVYTDLYGWLRNDTCKPFTLCDYIKRVFEGRALYYGLISSQDDI